MILSIIEVSKLLRKSGFRVTHQRLAIFDFLTNSEAHPTAQQIYEGLKNRFPSLSLATIYNTLQILVDQGFINSLGHAGDGNIHYDAHTEPHANVACLSCHKIIDIPSPSVTLIEKEIISTSGFNILGARVLYYGICTACQSVSV